ncbi:MAG: tRNA pseudouridine(13) synthase TruD [Acidobacteriota bacterium]
MARFRARPEDFEVEELPLYAPAGAGPFLWLWIEKRGLDTAAMAADIARALGLPRREVGWAGRKDRHAVTRQAITVPAHAEARLPDLDSLGAGLRILEVQRTDERLRTGQLIGNRFRLRVVEVEADQADDAARALARLEERGLANRFGAQRYGRDGRNAERGRALLSRARHSGDRRRAFLMISALQSRVFDEVLARRPADELWPGDLAVHHATGDWRWIDRVEPHQGALERFEISPTGPIFGTKTKKPRGRAAELEAEVLADFDLPPIDSLRLPQGLRLYGDRRALRVQPRRAGCRFDADERALEVSFELPSGSYATVLLEALFPQGLIEGPAAPAQSQADADGA